MIYSVKKELPLINDNPTLPVPALGNVSLENNAKILSIILAIESVKMVLPRLGSLIPEEIMEFRYQTKEYVRPFRLAMFRLSKELNAMIKSDMNLDEVQKAANILVETTVYPELDELRKTIHDPAKPWYRRAVDLAKSAPELASNFISMPKHLAIAHLLAKVASALADLQDERRTRESEMIRSGLYYLLKVEKGIRQ